MLPKPNYLKSFKLIKGFFSAVIIPIHIICFVSVFVFFSSNTANAQCPGFTCTNTITGTDSGNYTVNPGDTICISGAADFTGTVNLYGGALINCATNVQTFSVNFNFGSPNGVLFNYGSISFAGAGTTFTASSIVNNYGDIDFAGSMTTSNSSVYNNFGTTTVANNVTIASEFNNTGTIDVANLFRVNDGGNVDNAGEINGTDFTIVGDWTNSGIVNMSDNCQFNGASTTTIDGGCMSCFDWTNRGVVTGVNCGNIEISNTSQNNFAATLQGDIAIIDATPPAAAPFIDNNFGTVGNDIVWASCTTCSAQVEICNNGIDDDGDGLIDCADSDCSTNYATAQTNAGSVISPANVIGAPDGVGAGVGANSEITIDLGNALDIGDDYILTLGHLSSGNIIIEESIDGVNFFANSASPFTITSSVLNNTTFTTASHTRYVRITGVSNGALVDAVTYDHCPCIPTRIMDEEYQINGGSFVVADSVTIAEGGDLLLGFVGNGFQDLVFIWSGPNSFYQIATNEPFGDIIMLNNIQLNQDGEYKVFYYDLQGCVDSTSFFVEVSTAIPEICNNQFDDDGDGLMDCADSECGNTFYGAAETNSGVVINPANVIGIPDGQSTQLAAGAEITVDLGSVLNVGRDYILTLGHTLNGDVIIEESIDGVNFFPATGSPYTITTSALTNATFTTAVHTRYVKITSVSSRALIDAITYDNCICDPAQMVSEEYQINGGAFVAGDDVTVAEGDDLLLSFLGNNFGNWEFIWTGPNSFYQVVNTGGPGARKRLDLLNIQTSLDGEFKVFYFDNVGCFDSTTFMVTVIPMEICDNGIDDDGDGDIDCNDSDCALFTNDTDGDGVCDVLDLDNDNDGIPDTYECIAQLSLDFEGPSFPGAFPWDFYRSNFDFSPFPNVSPSRSPDFMTNADTAPGTDWFVSKQGANFAILQANNSSNTLTGFTRDGTLNDGIFVQYTAAEMASLGVSLGDVIDLGFLYAPGHNYDLDVYDADADTELKVWVSSSDVDGPFPTPAGGGTVTLPPSLIEVPGAWAPSVINAPPDGATDIMTDQWLQSASSHTYQGGDLTLLFLVGVGAIDSGIEDIFLDDIQIVICPDTDGDGVPNYLDLDSDNDGIYDLVEAGHNEADSDNDGIIDGSSSLFGVNGLFDGVETTADSDTLNYILSRSGDPNAGRYDPYTLDSDGDGCLDADEELVDDPDGDGIAGTGTPVVDAQGRVTGATYDDPTVNSWQNENRGNCLVELCGDGIDNNLDGLIDCQGAMCPEAQIIGSGPTCSGKTTTFEAADLMTVATYTWNFGANASPSSANGIGPHDVTFIGCSSGEVVLMVDELGCLSADTLFFAVPDNMAPVFDMATVPNDTTIMCNNAIPFNPFPTVTDNCSQFPQTQFTETSNRGQDICKQYNYQIERKWTAVDECGNISEAIQIITIEDPANSCLANNLLGGVAFSDDNFNGTMDDGLGGVEFVTVNLYGISSGSTILLGTTTTDANGSWSFNAGPVMDGNQYRVEFVRPFDLIEEFTPNGPDNGSNVQFVTAPNCSVNVGLANPDILAHPPVEIGNRVWLDANEDGIQDINEVGIPGVTIELYDALGVLVNTQITDASGEYYFSELTMGGPSISPFNVYYLAVKGANYDPITKLLNDSLALTTFFVGQAPDNNMNDSDASYGLSADPVWVVDYPYAVILSGRKGQSDHNTDFGFIADKCSAGQAEYAITDGAVTKPNQTTNYFWDNASTPASDMLLTQRHGTNRATEFCTIGTWDYYYNSNEPEIFLFAIEHGTNVTPIEYVEIRVENNITDRYSSTSDDATFVMARDWFVETVNDEPLLNAAGNPTTINIRFFFAEEEFKEILDAANAQATTWGGTLPSVTDVYWFNKDIFDSSSDIDATGTMLMPFDITANRAAATSATGVNTADGIAGQTGNGKNHIQFDGISSVGGGTAAITMNRFALPATLSTFNVEVVDCNAELKWQSESETDFSHYIIEKSVDGVVFEFVDQVQVIQSIEAKDYNYIDKNIEENYFYRLKLLNLDGTFDYTNIILSESACAGDVSGLVVFPNPISIEQSSLNVAFENKDETVKWITITDSFGNEKMTFAIDAIIGGNALTIDISNLVSGVHVLTLKGTKGKLKSKRFVVVSE